MKEATLHSHNMNLLGRVLLATAFFGNTSGFFEEQTCPDSNWHNLPGKSICYRAFESPTKTLRGGRGYCRRQAADLGFGNGTLARVFDVNQIMRDMTKRNDTPAGQYRIEGYQGRKDGKIRWLQFDDQLIPRDMSHVLKRQRSQGTLTVKPTTGDWFGHQDKDRKMRFICQVPAVVEMVSFPPREPCLGNERCCSKTPFGCDLEEGNCRSDDECFGDLICGTHNCVGPTFEDTDNCCYNPAERPPCLGGHECCGPSNLCGIGEGNCRNDTHCEAGLVCGRNNCVGPTFDDEDDCCHDPNNPPDVCLGGNGCCSPSHPCDLNEGVCSVMNDCQSLECGTDNCQGPTFASDDDCCFDSLDPPACIGGPQCCSPENLCGEYHGNCDDDNDCKPGLKCFPDHCPRAEFFTDTSDCCYNPSSPPVCTVGEDCCGPNYLCGDNEGDCDSDSDCQSGLLCGVDNCKDLLTNYHDEVDCCYDPGIGAPVCRGGEECCSASNGVLCQYGEGDCDEDADCAAGLVCGSNNCDTFYRSFDEEDDCCESAISPQFCMGGSGCCNPTHTCTFAEGQCSADEDCTGDLVCGKTNCLPIFGGLVEHNCCEDAKFPLPCVGGEDCCRTDRPCASGEGDCDDDDDCQLGLICGHENCQGQYFDDLDDCCYDPDAGQLTCVGGEDCCNTAHLCGDGEGDCDSDDDCLGSLICGKNNCQGGQFDDEDDCCDIPSP